MYKIAWKVSIALTLFVWNPYIKTLNCELIFLAAINFVIILINYIMSEYQLVDYFAVIGLDEELIPFDNS